MTPNQPLNILTIGAGAVGAFYSGKLAQQGAKVSVICRSEYDIVKKNGYSIQSHLGDFVFKPEHVYPSTQEVATQLNKKAITTFDIIIVTTKVLPEIKPETIEYVIKIVRSKK